MNDNPGGFDAVPAASRAMHLDNARTVPLQVSAPAAATTCAQAGQLRVPVTITKGELTRPFFTISAEGTRRCIPDAQLITIKGARHGSPSEQPAAFNEALLAFLDRQASSGPSTSHRLTQGMQIKTLKVNDVELAYVEQGHGPTVVFVHGFTGDWRTWDPLRPFLSDKYHYVSLSRRYLCLLEIPFVPGGDHSQACNGLRAARGRTSAASDCAFAPLSKVGDNGGRTCPLRRG